MGDAEDVEAAAPVKVDELCNGQLAVAPARVRVELAEKRAEASSHRSQGALWAPRRGEKTGLDFQERTV